jgi:hypothetical protein
METGRAIRKIVLYLSLIYVSYDAALEVRGQ